MLATGLLALAVLPLIDALGRPLTGLFVPGGAAWVQQLTLWLAFVGGLAAAGEGKHLTLSTAELFGERLRRAGHVLAAAVSAATVSVLAYASVRLLAVNRADG